MINRLAPALLLSACLFVSACSSSEERAEEYFESAQELAETGDVDRALIELRNVFQLNGSHLEARHLMARLLLEERKDRRGAYGQYLRLVEQYPDDLKARVKLAQIAISAGSWDEAERHGRMAEEIAPDAPDVEPISVALKYRAAVVDKDESARSEAARRAMELLSEHSETSALRAILIDHHVRNGSLREALENVDQLLQDQPDNELYVRQRLNLLARMEDAPGTEAQLRSMVEQFPDNQEYKAMLLRFHTSRGEMDAAEDFLRELADASEELAPKVDLIRFLTEVRGIEAARTELDRLIAENENSNPFKAMAAGMTFNEGLRDEAIQQMEQVIAETEPSQDLYRYKVALAQMLGATGNEIGARQQVEEVLEANPDNVGALKMQAAWYTEQDDTEAAISALRTALAADADDVEALTLMAEAYIRNGQPDLSRDFLSLAVEASGNAVPESIRYARTLIAEDRYLPAEDVLISALRLSPGNLDILNTLGQVYLRMEDYARVEGVVQTMSRLGTPQGDDAANKLEAERLNRTQGADEAMAFLEAIAADVDDDLGAQINLVRARLSTGDIESAVELARSLSADPADEDRLNYVLAVTETVAGNLETAETIFANLLESNANRPQIWLQISNVKRLQGDQEAAQSLIDDGLAANSGNGVLLWAKAGFLERDGDIDGAISIYDGLYELNSSSVIVANNLASLLSTYRTDQESLDRAWRIARRFSETDVPAMQDTYGWILQRRGDSRDALPYLEAAAEGLPNDPLVQFHLAETYMALDRAQDARRSYLAAVNIAGPADQRDQIEKARQMVQEIPATE